MLSTRPVSRNAEGNTHRHAFKTPSRGLAENRLGTMKGKGKAGTLQTPFQSKTPFQKPLFVEADTQLKGGVHAPARPFLDKTPFPNRIVNLDNANVHQTPYLHPISATPDSATRPSSTRRHIRVPRSSQKFETPLNIKNHWDVNDDSADGISMALPEPLKIVAPPEDDFDEIEYMPPNTLDLPYQPPFDLEMPDYKVLGKAFMEASRNGAFYESSESPVVFDIRPEDVEMCDINLDFSSIPDDDPFSIFSRKPTNLPSSKPKPISTVTNARSAPVSTKTGIVARAGAPTSSSRLTVAQSNKSVSRPETSTSVRPLSRPVSQATFSKSKTTLARPVTRASSVASKSTALPRESTRPANATTISRSKSTTATSRSHTANVVAAVSTRPASSAAASSKTVLKSIPTTTSTTKKSVGTHSMLTQKSTSSVRPNTNGTVTSATKPVRVVKVVPAELGGSIIAVDDVEVNLVEDFMFDV